jgi:TATA-box binding protein (TBP) (component of TFIID and TFIIIB)
MSVDEEWQKYMYSLNNNDTYNTNDSSIFKNSKMDDAILTNDSIVPVCEELYISTTTKVLFFNQAIDIQHVFWDLPIIKYSDKCNGIVKKQIKIISTTIDEYNEYMNKLDILEYYTENVIKSINNPDARRNKFKDERKLTVGMSKKDIMNCRGKVKNAFYNCFAIVIRFLYEDNYREIHVKVFNTGKLEIPGILNANIFSIIKSIVLSYIQPFIATKLEYVNVENEANVLINSNFNCGFYINRDILYQTLRSNIYGIEAAYEPCSYPGIKCKYYFNIELGFDPILQTGQVLQEDRNMTMRELKQNQKYIEVSFMIFRTGSCLIVGNCTEKILRFIYNKIKQILHDEYINIAVKSDIQSTVIKKLKPRKKTITMSAEYYNSNIV